MAETDNQLHPKTIKLPIHLWEDLQKHATKRGLSLSGLINNILYESNQQIKLKENDRYASQPAPGTEGD